MDQIGIRAAQYRPEVKNRGIRGTSGRAAGGIEIGDHARDSAGEQREIFRPRQAVIAILHQRQHDVV
jgi:hypothetical protein